MIIPNSGATFLRFYRPSMTENFRIIKWLNECDAYHYWRDYYVLVEFKCPEDAMAFKLAFDLNWMPDREAPGYD